MSRFLLITSFLVCGILSAGAQTEPADTLSLHKSFYEGHRGDSVAAPASYEVGISPLYIPLPPIIDFAPPPAALSTDLSIGDYLSFLSRPGVIRAWSGGGFYGAVSSQSLPGLMGIESGQLGFVHNAGRWTFEGFGGVTLYGSMFGVQRSLGFGGSVSYRVAPWVSLSAFGSYYTRPGMATPAMMGYMSVPTFGLMADFRLSDRWGVEVGGRSYRSMLTGHWETEPSVTPYYRVGNSRIGIDVGSMLYHLLRDNSGSSRNKWGPRNPTIGPPRIGTLPVGPAPPMPVDNRR